MHLLEHSKLNVHNSHAMHATIACYASKLRRELVGAKMRSEMPSSTPFLVPKTPMRSLRPTLTSRGPLFVHQEPLACGSKVREIADAELSALAHLIHSAFIEWKRR